MALVASAILTVLPLTAQAQTAGVIALGTALPVGAYRYQDGKYDIFSAEGFGLNAGVGIRLPRLHAFVEARAHVIKNAPDYLPITFGVSF